MLSSAICLEVKVPLTVPACHWNFCIQITYHNRWVTRLFMLWKFIIMFLSPVNIYIHIRHILSVIQKNSINYDFCFAYVSLWHQVMPDRIWHSWKLLKSQKYRSLKWLDRVLLEQSTRYTSFWDNNRSQLLIEYSSTRWYVINKIL